jgi:hypothetical protein
VAKTLETLSTFYRVLILVSATVLTIAVYYQPIPYQFSRALERVKQVEESYSQLIGELKANATDKYRKQFLEIIADRPKLQKEVVTKANFFPSWIKITDDRGIAQILDISDPKITLNVLLYLSRSNLSGSYAIPEFDGATLRKFFDTVVKDDSDLYPLYAADDLTIYVNPPITGGSGICWLSFRSQTGAHYLQVNCNSQTEQDVSEALRDFSIGSWQHKPENIYMPENLLGLSHQLAHEKIDALAAKESKEEKVDFLGPKLTIRGILNVGPLRLPTGTGASH